MGAGPLGYLFWHAPAGTEVSSRYEDRLDAWHGALSAHRPPSLLAGWSWRLPTPPWLPGWPDACYLDVYVVEDHAALGVLNEAAPAGALAPAHDAAAALSGYGSGALYQLRSGTPAPAPGDGLSWWDKRRGDSYPEALAALSGPGRAVWLRQMVLGAGPEILVVGAVPGPGWPPVWRSSPAVVAGTPPSTA
jgi:hypothetical protein